MEAAEAKQKLEGLVSETMGSYIHDFVDQLSNQPGVNDIRFVDEKIEDGLYHSLDKYLMQRSYAVNYRNHEFYVDVNYGNNTREITDYSVY